MDRYYELEDLRRSIVMLNPHAPNALSREKAIELIEELQVAVKRLRRIRDVLGSCRLPSRIAQQRVAPAVWVLDPAAHPCPYRR